MSSRKTAGPGAGTGFHLPYRRWKAHPDPATDFPDTAPMSSRPAAIGPALDRFDALLPGHVDLLAGIDMGGLGFAGALAARRGIGFVDIRKVEALRAGIVKALMANYELGYGLAMSKGGDIAGLRVAIVDDCIISGGVASAAVQLVRRLGGHCDTALFVFAIEGRGGAERLAREGVTAHVLETLPATEPEGR